METEENSFSSSDDWTLKNVQIKVEKINIPKKRRRSTEEDENTPKKFKIGDELLSIDWRIDNSYMCQVCGKGFKNALTLSYHEIHHPQVLSVSVPPPSHPVVQSGCDASPLAGGSLTCLTLPVPDRFTFRDARPNPRIPRKVRVKYRPDERLVFLQDIEKLQVKFEPSIKQEPCEAEDPNTTGNSCEAGNSCHPKNNCEAGNSCEAVPQVLRYWRPGLYESNDKEHLYGVYSSNTKYKSKQNRLSTGVRNSWSARFMEYMDCNSESDTDTTQSEILTIQTDKKGTNMVKDQTKDSGKATNMMKEPVKHKQEFETSIKEPKTEEKVSIKAVPGDKGPSVIQNKPICPVERLNGEHTTKYFDEDDFDIVLEGAEQSEIICNGEAQPSLHQNSTKTYKCDKSIKKSFISLKRLHCKETVVLTPKPKTFISVTNGHGILEDKDSVKNDKDTVKNDAVSVKNDEDSVKNNKDLVKNDEIHTERPEEEPISETKDLTKLIGFKNSDDHHGDVGVMKSPANIKEEKKSDKTSPKSISRANGQYVRPNNPVKDTDATSPKHKQEKTTKLKMKKSFNSTGDSDSAGGTSKSTHRESSPTRGGARLDHKRPRKIRRQSHSSDSCSDWRVQADSERRFSERRFKGEKPYICNHCPLKFSSLQNRVVHERTHREKPFECAFCEMRFTVEFNMIRHTKIHT